MLQEAINKNRVLFNTLLFFSSSSLNKAIPFLFLPILTKYLSDYDFGILGIIGSISAFLIVFIGNTELFIIVKGSTMRDKVLNGFIYNLFFSKIYRFLAFTIIFLLIKPFLFEEINFITSIAICLTALSKASIGFYLSILQIKNKGRCHLLINILKSSVSVSTALILIIIFEYGWEGRFFSELFVILIVVLVLLIKNHKNFNKERIKLSVQKKILKYLTPLTFHVIGMIMILNVDRIMILKFFDFEAVGSYFIGITFASIINIIHEGLSKTWSPWLFRKIKSKNNKTIINKFLLYYILFSVAIYILFISFGEMFFEILINPKFKSSYVFVPVLALAFSIESLRKVYASFLYSQNKNITIALITLSTGLLNVIFNYLLIPKLGLIGAAYSTLISFLIASITTFLITNLNKHEKDFKSLIKLS